LFVKIEDTIIKCRIVETEAYYGVDDRASHAYGGRKTESNKWLYEEGGHCYIYSIHGLNYLLNITCGTKENPNAVLIRAGEPVEGIDIVKEYRKLPKLSTSGKELTNGPGKLSKGMKIDKSFNGHDLTTGHDLYITDDNHEKWDIQISKRINVDYAGEDKNKMWRFYIKKNIFVSVK